jgi:NAD(P)H dehydrogenase (quinone)
MRVLVVYASRSGRTERMAREVAAGAEEAGAEVALRRAEDAAPGELRESDAVILGSGVHMGGVEAAMREFLARTAPLWLEGRLAGRIGAAFASAGDGERGGAELALISLWATLAEHGMLLVSMPNRLAGYRGGGCHWGPVAWTSPRGGEAGPTDRHLEAARAHGRHVAECTARWLAGARPA